MTPKVTPEKSISRVRWLNRWAGSYTFISCSFWGPQYFHSLKKNLGTGFTRTLFIHRRGTVSFFVADKEFRRLGKYLALHSERNPGYAKKYCDALQQNTDVLLPLLKKLQGKIPSPAEYQQFSAAFDRHLALHVFVKKTVDFLSAEGLRRLLPRFTQARVYSEDVYSASERFFRGLAAAIGNRENYRADHLTCLTQGELEAYLKHRQLPDPAELRRRYAKSALYFERDVAHLIVGSAVDRMDARIAKASLRRTGEVRGITAFPGTVTGRARIVLDPRRPGAFSDGDILITGMTRPEFLPIIRRAGAIVTDVGGVLCHAAITARELKIPCVVGTAVATKVFNNNQPITVSAGIGIVRAVRARIP